MALLWIYLSGSPLLVRQDLSDKPVPSCAFVWPSRPLLARSVLRLSASDSLPISVVIVARNEEKNLPRCLASVQGWVAEIVVALNNTVDASASIARGAGAVVHELAWQGYRDTKNAALLLAGQPWILALDADEAVSPLLRDAITGFFRGTTRDFAGARFPRKVWFIDRWIRHGDWYPDLSLRLFRRGDGKWGGDAFVHEKIECSGAIATLPGDLYHFSFPTVASHVAKIAPFADLFVQQQQARGRGFSWLDATVRPAWRFLRAYILRRGFLDGFPGLYIAWATAFGAFVRYSRLYEAAHRREPPAESSGR